MVTCNDIYSMYQSRKPEAEILQAFREVPVDDRDNIIENRTPLHLACYIANEEAARICISRGADVNAKDSKGNTPLFTLANVLCESLSEEDRRTSIAILLLDHGARISRSAPNTTALIEAVRHRHFRMASAIVRSGCRIDQTNGNGENALHTACEAANVEMDLRRTLQNLQEIRSLITVSEEVRKQKLAECEEKVAYYEIKEKESLDFIRLLLANGQIDPDGKSDSGSTPWDCAINSKSMKAAALLSGSDPDHDELAALHGNMDIFQAMWHNNLTALNALLRSGVELQTVCEHKEMYDFYGKSPLACALIRFREHPEMADMLLDAGADPNYRFGEESTAFEIGAQINLRSSKTERHILLLEKMLRHGWNIEMPADKEGNTALAVACRHSTGNFGNAAIPLLLKNKADVNAANRCGQTPLMLLYGGRFWDGRSHYKPYEGRIGGDEEAVFLEMILEAGADTGRKDIWGNTLLHYLAGSCGESGARKATDLLADFGVPDVAIVNNEGLTALDIATEKGNETMVKFLIK